jgi:outer membrane protein assembly factor BamB
MLGSRRYIITVFALAVTAFYLTARLDGATMPSWTQYQGNAAHTGYVLASVDATKIAPLWSLTRAQLGQSSLIPGAVTDGSHVYISAYSESTYQVLALDPITGSTSWSCDLVPHGSHGFSAPSVGNGEVYVHQWGQSSGVPASEYPYLFGLNAATGSIQFATSHPGQWSSGSRPTIADTQAFAAGGYFGGLDAYNGVAGGIQWSAPVNQQYGWIPAADAQNVYVYMGRAGATPGPSIGTLYRFDRTTGARTSILNTDDTISMRDGTVFLGGPNTALALTNGSGGQTLVSFDLAAGNVRWRSVGNYQNCFAITDGIIFAPNGSELDLLDEATGQKVNQWLAPAGQSLAGNLLVTDNLIFAQTGAATYALNRQTLSPVWSTNMTGDLALGDNMLVISNSIAISAFAVPEPATVWLLSCVAIGIWRHPRRM